MRHNGTDQNDLVEQLKTHEELKMNAFGLSDQADSFSDRYSKSARAARREAAAAETALIEFEVAHPEVLAEEDRLRREQSAAALAAYQTGRLD
jgi:alpha-beta hydrolase superfamily lysophospholipase